MNRHALLLAALAALLVATGCSKKADEAGTSTPDDRIAATVEDWSLTRDQLEDFLRRLPDTQQRRYDTPQGRAELAEKMMQEELAYREAKKLNLASKEDVKKQIDEATRTILVAAYLKDQVDVKAHPTEEEIHEYYDTHQDLYTTLETIRAQHIFSKDKQTLVGLKERVEEGGEKFTTLAHRYSEDKLTQADGGDLGYFNPGGYIKGVGYSQIFTDQLLKMEPGKVYGPIKWEQGYSLVRINERQPAELRPYDEVHDEIVDRLSRDKIEDVRAAHFAEVEKNYKTRNLMQETYAKMQRGPEELFNYAQNSADPRQRIAAFQEIIDKFPKDKYAPQAMFMIGFVYAEELKDFVMADKTFNSLIDTYPESDMAQTAKWMLDNLNEPLPKFEDLNDLNRQIESKSN